MDGKRKCKVILSTEQRRHLEEIVSKGNATAKKTRRARVLLLADEEHPDGRWHDQQIAKILGIHRNTVARIRGQFVVEGEQAINRRRREHPPIEAKLDGKQEAQLVAICCSPPPEGRAVWTLSLLVDALKERGIVTEISRETVRKSLKKTSLSHGASNASVSLKPTEPGSLLRWKKCSISTLRRIPQKSR
jgi:transposase